MCEAASGIGDGDQFKFNPILLTVFPVIDEFSANRLPLLHAFPHAVEFWPVGLWTLQKTGGLEQHLFATVSGLAQKRFVDKYDGRPGLIEGLGLRNHHHVVQPGNAGLQKRPLLLRFVPFRHVAKIDCEGVLQREHADLKPSPQRWIKTLERGLLPFRHGPPRPGCKGRAEQFRKFLPKHFSQQFAAIALQQADGFTVEVSEPPGLVERAKRFARLVRPGLRLRSQAYRIQPQVLLRTNVMQRAVQTRNFAGCVPLGMAKGPYPDPAIGCGDHFHFQIEAGTLADTSPEGVLHCFTPLRGITRDSLCRGG